MKRSWMMGVWSVALVAAPHLVMAANEQAKPAEQKAAPVAPVPTVAPASAAPMPMPMAPAVSSAEGRITWLDLKAVPPTLGLLDADGRPHTGQLDTKATAIWKGDQELKLTAAQWDQAIQGLKIGQRVKVSYVLSESKELVKSIQLAPEKPAPAQAAFPAKTY